MTRIVRVVFLVVLVLVAFAGGWLYATFKPEQRSRAPRCQISSASSPTG